MLSDLIAVPAAGDWVCRVCRGPKTPGSSWCPACASSAEQLDIPDVPEVLPLAMAPDLAVAHTHGFPSDYTTALYSYKGRNIPNPDPRAQEALIKAVTLLAHHEKCLAERSGSGDFPVVTFVPSSMSGPSQHWLHYVLSHVPRFRDRLRLLLTEPRQVGRNNQRDRFQFQGTDVPEDVLLIDDLWVTGSAAMSAYFALRQSGVKRVGVLVLGRYLSWKVDVPGEYAGLLRGKAVDPGSCAFCATESPEAIDARPRSVLTPRWVFGRELMTLAEVAQFLSVPAISAIRALDAWARESQQARELVRWKVDALRIALLDGKHAVVTPDVIAAIRTRLPV